MANLLVDTLFYYRNEGEYRLHAFVIMRDHFHALITIQGTHTIERAVQKIKGNFSYRSRREPGFTAEIWQRGFTDERIRNAEQFLTARTYIHNNPVRNGMVMRAEEYRFSSAHAKYRKPAAKA